MRKQYTILQRLKSLKGQHVSINTDPLDSDKTVRINSRTYTVAASIIGMQTKPRAGVAMTNDIIGIESMPGMNSGFASTAGIVCFKAEPYLGSTAGTITGDIRSYEATLGKPSGAGTVTGAISALKAMNNCNATVTGGVHVIHVVTHGDTLAWTSFALLPDDDQIADDDDANTAGTKAGWIKVNIGTPSSKTVRYLRLYDSGS